MSDKLTIKDPQPDVLTPNDFVLLLMLLVPVVLGYFAVTGSPIPVAAPFLIWVNLIVVICATFTAFKFSTLKIQVIAPDETVIPRQSFSRVIGSEWWTAIPLAPALVMAISTGIESLVGAFGNQGAVISAGSMLGSWTVALILRVLIFGIVFPAVQPRVSDKGIRPGIVHLLKWDDIDYVVRDGHFLHIIHRCGSDVPFMTLYCDDEIDELIRPYLKKNRVNSRDALSPEVGATRWIVMFACVGLLAAGYWFNAQKLVDERWTILLLLIGGMVIWALLDWKRGALTKSFAR